MKGKMLMFAKKPLRSFVYNVIDVFCFPTQQAINIKQQNQIIKCLLSLNLTDVDSCSLSFVFVCNLSWSRSEGKARNLIFEILLHSKLKYRLDTSYKFSNNFNAQNKLLKKKKGLYEIESIDNPNMITTAVNSRFSVNDSIAITLV